MRIAYIDAQNIHKGIQSLGRTIDRAKFYCYLHERFNIVEVNIFFGYISHYQKLYNFLRQIGYAVIFKEVSVYKDGTIKGNVDIDIAICSMKDSLNNRLTKAYLVTTDSDFNTLICEFRDTNVRGSLFVSSFENTSKYLRKAAGDKVFSLSDIKHIIEFTYFRKETDA